MSGEKMGLITIPSTTEPKTDSSKVEPKSDVSIDGASRRISAQDLSNLPFDATNKGSNFIFCPEASIPSDIAVNPDAGSQRIDALVQYANKFPTEPQAIQNLLLFASNMANEALLSKEMKKELIQKISIATNNSVQKASVKYQGLRGESGSNQFLADVTAPFKLVGTTISSAEVVHQTLRAVSGKLLMVDATEAHPSASEMLAQNKQLLQSLGNSSAKNGASAPNGLGGSSKSSSKASAASNVGNQATPPPLGGRLPAPVLPESGAPKPPVSYAGVGSVGLKGIKDYYAQILQYIHAHPGDIKAMQYLMQFLVDVSNVYKGNIPKNVTDILDAGHDQGAGALDAIASMIPRLAKYSFFTGYEGTNGAAGMTAYIAAMKNALSGASGKSSPYLTAMSGIIDRMISQQFVAQYTASHTNATGGLCYNEFIEGAAGQPPIMKTYNWDNSGDDPEATMTSQQYILGILNNQAPTTLIGPDPFNVALDSQMSTIDATYRVSALADLLAQYKDPLIAITLWIMQVYDNQYQTEEGGLNETTDDLTTMTNDIATRLSTLAQSIGQNADGSPRMTQDQVKAFADTLADGSTLMDSMYQMNGIESSWDNNVFKDMCGIKIDPNSTKYPQGITVGQLLFGNDPTTGKPFTPAQQAQYLCMLNPAPPSTSFIPPGPTPPGPTPPGPPPASLNQGYQEIVGDLQQAGSLITGRSKVVSLELQQTSDCDSQDIKAWSTILQDLAQFVLKGPITGQKTG
jgi:hypothetical protein